MRLLFEIGGENRAPGGTVFARPSVRAVIAEDGKLAMIHSLKYDYYKFPGGGAEHGEGQADTLVREVREESGLTVRRDTIREYGMVRRVEKGLREDVFLQENFYYLCDVERARGEQTLDDYESDERFTLEYVTPEHAIRVNQSGEHGEKALSARFFSMLERENRVLQTLMAEGVVST